MGCLGGWCGSDGCEGRLGSALLFLPFVFSSSVPFLSFLCSTPTVADTAHSVLVHGGSFEETITRGKAYLEAGATSVFVWGGGSGRVGDASAASGANEDGPKNFGISKQEIEQLVTAFDGRLNVSLKLGVPGALTVAELAKIGVSRISIGPTLQFKAMERVAEVAGELLGQDA